MRGPGSKSTTMPEPTGPHGTSLSYSLTDQGKAALAAFLLTGTGAEAQTLAAVQSNGIRPIDAWETGQVPRGDLELPTTLWNNSDAAAIGELTGEDPWVFEQGARPGWFVASDGDRVVGVIQVADAGGGLARVRVPVLASGYGGRELELWMLDRAATYAETNGYHTAEVAAHASLESVRKGMESRFWVRDGAAWRRIFFTPKPAGEADWD